ncbi:MAG TPA: ribonuclease HII [Acidobacteriota bacterium]|nr:ribonuclease HII [Acidobacteriota bacterium]
MATGIPYWSVAEIRRRFLEERQPVSNYRLGQMRRDRREGVRRIAAMLSRQMEQERREALRMQRIRRLERVLWGRGVEVVAGVDEAGVGPLAGPVVAAAVALPRGTDIARIDDSKKLDPPTRRQLEREICRQALCYSLASADVEEIDRLNIYHAALLAMRRAVEGLGEKAQFVLTDARTIPGLDRPPQRAVPKGDRNSISVAAASILAKNHRDRLMVELDRRFPLYGFAQHKGYGTDLHCRSIQKHGLCAAHRRSFHVLDEIRGRFCSLFYRLREEMKEASCASGLKALADEIGRRRENLSDSELIRLRALLARRRRVVKD